MAAGVVQRLGDGERQHFWQAPTAAHREKMKLLLRQFEQADSSPVDIYRPIHLSPICQPSTSSDPCMGIGHEVDTDIGPSRIQPCTAAAPTHAESAL